MRQRLTEVRIVLVEPSHPGNIGGAARAMKTMGLGSLWLVRPERYPDPQAEWRAAGALDVLDGAHVVDDLNDAIGDCRFVVGTSTRSRRIPWPTLDARGAAERVIAEPPDHPVAILFGRETSGLTNEELQRCHVHLQIPANPDYPSLNLAMAVQVVCYELWLAHASPVEAPVSPGDRELAPVEDVEAMLVHLEAVLGQVGFLEPSNPGQVLARFRRLFTRLRLDETEVKMLRGLFTETQRSIAQLHRDAEIPPTIAAPSPPER
jgi:tRNA (cytidine32/uridine32-2'-O)-methyltransferase